MATRAPRAATPTPAPSAAPQQQDIDELTQHHQPHGLVAKRSKLATAMDTVTAHMTAMEALGATIAEVEQKYPKDHVFAVTTKEGYKLADKVRADARKSRLHVADMRKEGTNLLNTLKTELWAVADPQIARLQSIEDNAKAQVDAQDKKETDRKRKHEDNLLALTGKALHLGDMTSDQIAERMSEVEEVTIDDTWEEFKDRAAKALQDVRDTLSTAFTHTMHRELEQAEQRAREAKQAAARAQIAHYKALPDAHEESDVEALQDVLTTIPPRDDDAEKYGDMAEFVDMARDKALTVLQAMLKAAVDNREEAARQARVQTTAHAQDDGAEVLAQQDGGDTDPGVMYGEGGIPDGEVDEDPFSVEAMQRKARASVPGLAAAPAHAPATGFVGGIANGFHPTPRVSRMARPVATPAPTPAPSSVIGVELNLEGTGRVEQVVEAGETPDLLKSARIAVAAWTLIDESVLSASAISALRNLRAAVDFATEFAD